MEVSEIPIVYEFDQEFFSSFREEPGMFVIYIYTLPDGSQYVGQTRNLYKRHYQHLGNPSCPVDYSLRKHKPIPRILWMGPMESVNDMERYYISKYNTLHPNGWNFTEGGNDEIIVSEATRKKLSERYWDNVKSGRVVPDASHLHTPEIIEKRRKKRCRPVLCYSLTTGKFLKEYESTTEAAKELGLCGPDISRCLNGKAMYVKSYVFRRKIGTMYKEYIDLEPIVNALEDLHRSQREQLMLVTRSEKARLMRSMALKGRPKSEEHKQKISETMKGRPSPLKGRKLTEEQKQHRKELIAERHPDLYERQGKARSGAKATRAKSIYQRARNGVILARFETIKDAVEATGIDQSAISTCLAGKVKTAGGYIWTLTEDSAEKFGLTVDVPKLMKILQIDEDGNIVNEFATSRDAYALTGIKDGSIRRAICNGTTAGGYKWMKVVEE